MTHYFTPFDYRDGGVQYRQDDEHPGQWLVETVGSGGATSDRVLCGTVSDRDAEIGRRLSAERAESKASAEYRDLNRGTWYRAACSGLWYRNPAAAGSVDSIKIEGRLFPLATEPETATPSV